MMNKINMITVTRTLVWLSGAVAFPLSAAITVLTILDAVSSPRYISVSVVAATLDVIALGLLTVAITLVLRRDFGTKRDHTIRWPGIVGSMVCACFELAAATTTIVELVLSRQQATQGDEIRETASLVTCVAALLGQTLFYCAIAILCRGGGTHRPSSADSRPCTPEERTRPMSLRILTPPRVYIRQDQEKSSPLLNDSATSLPTLRSSIAQAVRPTSSKTRLLRSPVIEHSHFSHSLRSSIDSLSRGDAFDSWDTSDVDSDTREAVLSTCPRRKGALEPIPGSRPGSPGRPLDGPFNESSSPPASSPTTAEANSSPYYRPNTSYSNHSTYSRPVDSRVSLSSTRPTSPSVNEAHIHPLFRTDSPTPAPAHTLNTVIVASPIAGQFISPPAKVFSRMNSRENTHAGISSPVAQSKSFASERGSFASSNPPSRAITPPIPDFVLSVAT